MDDKVFDNIDIATPSVVKQSARDFAAALSETPQFKTLEKATDCFRQDQAAQQAMGAYQEKQNAWRALLMLNALSPEQKAELEELHGVFINQPLVQEYIKAQMEFATICQTLGDALSESIGLNYAAACGASCCG
jgi:cell fate (sporulation/competence/biofilm development) regulator YlbF (YheA/YmcA/DUF963 family)